MVERMSKVIAIIDRPDNCQKCWFSACHYSLPLSTRRKGYSCKIQEPNKRVVEDFDYDAEVYLSSCPLKEVPKKPDYPPINESSYVAGWNACIDDILKGSEENE